VRDQIYDWQVTFARYQSLLNDGSVNVLRVLEEAPLPTRPISSGLVSRILLAAALGLVLGLGSAFLLDHLDDTFKSAEDLSKHTQVTAVGAIPFIEDSNPTERLVSLVYPKSPIAEAYRSMRTNIGFLGIDLPLRSLVITSANPGEGKSTTVANLGVVIAQSGKSVVLVDSDLRRPMLHRIFELPNRQGLTDVLLDEDPAPNGHLCDTAVENLHILTSGPLPPNPSEVLGSAKMGQLVRYLAKSFDLVLLDAPPALPVTDAAVLASQADGVVVVAGAGQTRRQDALKALERLRQVGGQVLGVALSRWRLSRGGYYRYYAYYETYGSASGKGGRERPAGARVWGLELVGRARVGFSTLRKKLAPRVENGPARTIGFPDQDGR
jgi:non-specific protein-tyrosine kinase